MTRVIEIYADRVASGALKPDPVQEAVLPEFSRLANALQTPVKRGLFRKKAEAPKGIYLWGGVGRGKSMLMDLFVEAVGEGVRRVHFHAFMQEVHKGLHAARARGVEDALVPVAKEVSEGIRCLAFDEMQITDITDAMVVGRLFEMLFDAGVTVVTTSNRVLDDLYKDGLNRQLFLPFIDFIKEHMTVWELASDTDYRQDRLSGEQVYFAPADAAARAAIGTIWADFGGATARPLVLTVNKREVEIPAFVNGVARASFYDLCGKALGPADYLALAEAARVLILEDIPQLSSENFNAAKRFVTLVDALYEAQVKVIATAAAQPEMLYLEGVGAFEFERTASRLREMQDANWGRDA
ncbi:cell division protein ZapE [Primorskyibacter sp. S187A]|uniref:cell division protein ZapE n=1 Tax=Primorskyibacter sp. S187A TaxID=3415130 RepID=UPI003C7E5FFC